MPNNYTIMSKQTNKTPERSPYETILALCLALLIVHFVFAQSWAVPASLGLGLAGLLSSTLARWIHVCWLRLTYYLGFVMTHVLLFLVFYFFLWPISLLYHLSGKRTMKKSVGERSNYVERDHTYVGEDMEKMW